MAWLSEDTYKYNKWAAPNSQKMVAFQLGDLAKGP
jgi:hypothetical protein